MRRGLKRPFAKRDANGTPLAEAIAMRVIAGGMGRGRRHGCIPAATRLSVVLTLACVSLVSTSVRAADNFDCGPGGVPDPKTSKCTCPKDKIEKTTGGISRCVAKPPVVVPKPPKPPQLPTCSPSQIATADGCVDKCPADEVYKDGACVARCPATAKWDGVSCVAVETKPPLLLDCPPGLERVGDECRTIESPSSTAAPPVASAGTSTIATSTTSAPIPDDVPSNPAPIVITDEARRWGPQRLEVGIPLGFTSARGDVTYGGGGIGGAYHFSEFPLLISAALTTGPYRALDAGCASPTCSSPATGRGTAVLFELTAAFAPFSVAHALESPVSLLNPWIGPTFAVYDYSRKDASLQKPGNGAALLLSAGNTFLFRFVRTNDGLGVYLGVTPAVAAGIGGGGAMPLTRASITFTATVVGP
jgi:hypothetical protein